jgi:hypothetical protein
MYHLHLILAFPAGYMEENISRIGLASLTMGVGVLMLLLYSNFCVL